jgi:hypothetical protein
MMNSFEVTRAQGQDAARISAGLCGRLGDAIVRAVSRLRSVATRPVSVGITTALLAAVNLAVSYPGEATADSQSQYAQAVAGQFDDGHPPIMAWMWSIFRLVADGDGPMCCFQLAGYWLGFGLIAIALARTGRSRSAWAMLGVALFPSLVTLNGVLLKDVGMSVTFLTAFAAFFFFRIQDRQVPPGIVALSLVLVLYGALVRTNAVFAVVSLFAYMIRPRGLARPWRLLAVSIPVALALVPAADLFNHRILQAERFRIVRSLQIFDIAGTAFYSGDLGVFGPGSSFTWEQLTGCYQPERWDGLAPWGCRDFWIRLAVSGDLQGFAETLDDRAVQRIAPNLDLPGLWIAAIRRHPLAYARHRLAHFGSEVIRGASKELPEPGATVPLHMALYDWVTASAVWLLIGAGLLLQLASARSLRRAASLDAALALALSGLPYAGAYLVIGVGTELRYMYWSLMAIFTALVISLPDLEMARRRTSLQVSGS